MSDGDLLILLCHRNICIAPSHKIRAHISCEVNDRLLNSVPLAVIMSCDVAKRTTSEAKVLSCSSMKIANRTYVPTFSNIIMNT